MKYIFTTLAIVLCALNVEAQSRIKVLNKEHDFGTIQERGGDVTCDFVVKNISRNPVVISRVHTTCSCVTTRYNRRPIAPATTDTLRVTFDPRFRRGVIFKSIIVDVSGEQKPITLTIRGSVNDD